MDAKQKIINNKTSLGIELGSTRIKAVLLDDEFKTIATGQHCWENKFENNLWTYSLEDIWNGVQDCYSKLKADVKNRYNIMLTRIGAIGISAMMHGYMVFDKSDKLLVPFRTWRNNNAEEAAKELTELFGYNIPARWSISHLYQAVLNKEPHVSEIAFQTTLEGYVHFMLTGQKIIGIGEASGMFPIDIQKRQYNQKMTELFDALSAVKGMPWRLLDIFPKIMLAGNEAGHLTERGAKLLDPAGDLMSGIPFCPPEGDAGTGMVATNSIKPRTGNVSAGTSIFGMVVLENELEKVHPEIDLVTTPAGDLVAMVHCNNCTSEINVWMDMFAEVADMLDVNIDRNELFAKLFKKALDGDADAGGLIACNYLSGENITEVTEGRPMLLRTTTDKFNLANLMRAQLYASIVTLKIGLDILLKKENVKVDSICGHGGIFKTEGVFQKFLSAAVNAPVSVMSSANEGGPWGMAVLAIYMLHGKNKTLSEYLDTKVFACENCKIVEPDINDVKGINEFTDKFVRVLPVIRAAVETLKR